MSVLLLGHSSGGASALFVQEADPEGTTGSDAPQGLVTPSEEGSAKQTQPTDDATEDDDYIKWVSFDIPYDALKRAMDADIDSRKTDAPLDWIKILALQSARYWGKWQGYRASDLNSLVYRLQNGETVRSLSEGYGLYEYYYEAYSAVLSGFVGWYAVRLPDYENGAQRYAVKYGLKAFSPIAKGFWYNHYDDYGASRAYGFSRVHLGNDLMGSLGTPIIAVESGVVEALGWNQYGGWRIGIRSFDGLRYFYYAHLRKDRPYAAGLEAGDTVRAGDVIGYMGRTGYSANENVNNIKTVHLHIGLQLIFDESQADGTNEIWIDVYPLVKLLSHNRSEVIRDEQTREHVRTQQSYDLSSYDLLTG